MIVRLGPGAERIPLTIADADPVAGTITLIIQSIGKSTTDLVALRPGDAITDVAGPLGSPTHLLGSGHAVCVGGGVGTAVILPIAQELARRGVRVTSIIGGRSKEWVILEEELARAGEVITCTDDGSYGRPGFVTQALADVIAAGGVDEVFAVGPVPMMKAVSELTRPSGVKTTVSLNAIMVDGTGMCGGCRVSIAGETRYACVDGPEFDGHTVDFAELADRLTTYRTFEQAALERRAAACLIPALAEKRRADSGSRPMSEHERPAKPADRSAEELVKRILAGESVEVNPRERMLLERVPMPEQDAEERSHTFRRGQPRLHRASRGARGRAVPPVQEPQVHRRLPGPGQHPALHRPPAAWRHGRRRRLAPRRQRAAVRHRARLPAGDPVRGPLPQGQEGHIGRHRLARALRRRLGAGASGGSHRGDARRRASGPSRSSAPGRPG